MGLNPIRVTRYICCEVGTCTCRYPELFRYICDRIIKNQTDIYHEFPEIPRDPRHAYRGRSAGLHRYYRWCTGNIGLFVGLGLILLGYVLHIVLDKKASEQERLHN